MLYLDMDTYPLKRPPRHISLKTILKTYLCLVFSQPLSEMFPFFLSQIVLPFQHVCFLKAGDSSVSLKKFGLSNATCRVSQSTVCRTVSKQS